MKEQYIPRSNIMHQPRHVPNHICTGWQCREVGKSLIIHQNATLRNGKMNALQRAKHLLDVIHTPTELGAGPPVVNANEQRPDTTTGVGSGGTIRNDRPAVGSLPHRLRNIDTRRSSHGTNAVNNIGNGHLQQTAPQHAQKKIHS